MATSKQLRDTVLKYRLDELDGVEREKIDALLIGDADFHAAFRDAEYDLLDAYACNELTSLQRERVERALQPRSRASFGPMPNPRRKMAAAKPFVGRFLMPWMGIAAAFTVVVASGIVWRAHLNQTRANSVQPQVVAQVPRSDKPLLADQGMQPHTASSTKDHLIASVNLLLTDTVRGQSSTTVHLPKTANELRVQWSPSGQPAFDVRYQLEVVGEDGKKECRADGIYRRASGRGSLVEFVCPVGKVAAGVAFFRVRQLPDDTEALPLLEETVVIEK